MKQYRIIPGILCLIACFWIYRCVTTYGIWNEGPRGGFMPLLAGLITLGFSLAAMWKGKIGDKPWHWTIFIPVACVVAVILAIPVLGLLPGIFLMLVLWFRFLEKFSWKFTLGTSVCVLGCVWLIFSLWLMVPFPRGLLD